MREIDNLCAHCWNELTEGSVCTECGFDNDNDNEMKYLPKMTILQDKYIVGLVAKHESDAVTYYGYDGQIDKPILIRELYPKNMANRLEGNNDLHIRQKFIQDFEKYKKSFQKLWTTMEKLHSLSAVVPVYDVFEANGTVYAIIEDMESIPMREYLLRNDESYILWDNARLMFMPVLTTIEALHTNGIIHGSINPDNLMLCRDGKVRLAPFPIAEACDIASPLDFVETEGYTALEQYDNNHKICPATDIYSFSACVYRALVGTNPPSAKSREANDKLMIPNNIAENIPIHVIKALVGGLQVYPEKRIKAVETFRELLNAAPAVQVKQAPQEDIYQEGATGGYPEYNKKEKKPVNKKNIVIAVLAILIVIAVGASIYLVRSGVFKPSDTETTTAAPSQTFEVPNFINNDFTQSDIQNNGAWNEQFNFIFQGDFSTDVEAGIIFKQSVAAGTTVEKGTEITLTVSKGIQTEKIPDVGGLTLDDAKKTLEGLGFKVSVAEVYNDGSYTKDTVKSLSGSAPAAGSVVAVGEEVILQVYGEVQTTQPAE